MDQTVAYLIELGAKLDELPPTITHHLRISALELELQLVRHYGPDLIEAKSFTTWECLADAAFNPLIMALNGMIAQIHELERSGPPR